MWAVVAWLSVCTLGFSLRAWPAEAADRLIELSPYYLEQLSNATAPFPKDDYHGRSFRMFGIDDSVEEPMKGLNRAQAKQHCLSVGGLGLASVFNLARKEALDAVVAAAANTFPQVTKDQYAWVGGFRTTLSEPNCRTGTVTQYPYFTEFDPSSWNGCGTDRIEDWAWSRPAEGGGTAHVMWSDLQPDFNLAPYWDSEEVSGIPSDDGNPSAFSDYTFDLTSGFFENCTVAIVYGDENLDVNENARNKAYWRDWGCRAPLYRWVCEMPDEAGLGEGATVGSVASAGYFIEGVSSESRTTQKDMSLRLFGILPKDSEGDLGEGLTALKWYQATHTCLALGAQGLAYDSTPLDHTARSTLLNAAYESLKSVHRVNSIMAWIGGFTTYVPGPSSEAADPITTEDFTWWTNFEEGFAFETGSRERWVSVDFPTSDAALFSDPESPDGGDEAMTSCVYVTADATSTTATWRHRGCNDTEVQLFMCQFGSDGLDEVYGAMASSTDPAAVAALGNSGSSTEAGGDDHTAAIVGAVVAAAVLILAGVVGFLFVRKRRRDAAERSDLEARKGAKGDVYYAPSLSASTAARKGLAAPGALPLTTKPGSRVITRTVGSDVVKALAVQQDPSKRIHAPGSYLTVTNTMVGSVNTGCSGVSFVDTACTNASDLVYDLEERLRVFANSGLAFADRFVLSTRQRVGGQGVVQFATGLYNGYEYALKFFIKPEVFEAELVLYKHPTLQHILPNIEDAWGPNNLVPDGEGCYFPPVIVLEKGEALDEWSERAKPDVVTGVQVLIHLSARLSELHRAGLAHRDLKPANVMWLPRENRWTIIDFGCAAEIGVEADIAMSLAYAAPEVIKAIRTGQSKIVVDATFDGWSVGVMAYELLTGERAFDSHGFTCEEVMDLLCDERNALPWEGENLTKENARKLGSLRKPILQLLSRNPADRPTMAEFKTRIEGIFAGSTLTHA